MQAYCGHRLTVLVKILQFWSLNFTCQVRREKAIYHTLNKLSIDNSRKVLIAEAWCPLTAKPRVHEALRQASEQSSTQVRTAEAHLRCIYLLDCLLLYGHYGSTFPLTCRSAGPVGASLVCIVVSADHVLMCQK